MANGRRQHNLTVLADGTVLATGGNSSGAGLVDLNHGVYAGELWNPATGTWKTLAAEQVTRQYHSTALLLAGRARAVRRRRHLRHLRQRRLPGQERPGVHAPVPVQDRRLRRARAPADRSRRRPPASPTGPASRSTRPTPPAIRKVALVRLGAVTHSVNMEQRYVPLTFTAGAGSLTATAPANANIAPPGVYMLFLVDAAGVPSVAKMVTVGVGAPRPRPRRRRRTCRRRSRSRPRPTARRSRRRRAITTTATAADADGTVARVEFLRNGSVVAKDTTSPYSWRWSSATPGTHTVTARAVDNAGASDERDGHDHGPAEVAIQRQRGSASAGSPP